MLAITINNTRKEHKATMNTDRGKLIVSELQFNRAIITI